MVPTVEIFCVIDDFCKLFEESAKKNVLPSPNRKRKRQCNMSLSEIMTIIILFHFSHYRTFKDFYLHCILDAYKKEFPNALSYNRFVELQEYAFMPLVVFLRCLRGKDTGKYYIDSTKIPVCHNLRIKRHKVFKDIAKRGKTSTGWFFGFKLHCIFNNEGELMEFDLTPGNVDDRAPVEHMCETLDGWLFGDRGYISKKLADKLKEKGVELITKTKRKMKEVVLDPAKKFLLEKRGVIETIYDQLKNLFHIAHTRHRSVMNAQVNIVAGLIAYCFKPKKVQAQFHMLNNADVKIQTLPLENKRLTSN